MAENKVYQNDTGTKIVFDIGIDASLITLAQIKVKYPDNTTATWTATPVIGTTTIEYITTATDLSQAGLYTLQPYIETADWKGHGTYVYLKVEKHI